MISGMGLGGGEQSLGALALDACGAEVDGRVDAPVLRARIALFEVRATAFRAMSEKFLDELKARRAHPAQPSMMKYYGTELNKQRHELAMAAGGSDALEWESERSRGGIGRAHLAAHQGQFDRGRHLRGPAQHRRQAHSRTAGGLIHAALPHRRAGDAARQHAALPRRTGAGRPYARAARCQGQDRVMRQSSGGSSARWASPAS